MKITDGEVSIKLTGTKNWNGTKKKTNDNLRTIESNEFYLETIGDGADDDDGVFEGYPCNFEQQHFEPLRGRKDHKETNHSLDIHDYHCKNFHNLIGCNWFEECIKHHFFKGEGKKKISTK